MARKFADRIAVSCGSSQLTYRELNEQAERLAHLLRQRGVGQDQLVGLCLERGCSLLVGLLGILKAGGAYVPIDPTYPAERRNHLLRASQVQVVIASSATAALLADRLVLNLDDLPTADTDPQTPPKTPDASSLAYVIFTSGSCGEPKGVLIEHGNVMGLFHQTAAVFDFNEHDVWCNFHSVAFDFSVWEIWGPLLQGGRLVIPLDAVRKDPQAFYELLVNEGVTVLNQTPSAFRNLMAVDSKRPAGQKPLALRYVIFGGERLDYRMLAPWVERHGIDAPQLVNMYGITETTVHVTWKRITLPDLAAKMPQSIGTPLGDMRVVILDATGALLPPGQEGVMHIAGRGLSRGYLHRDDLTDERFTYRHDLHGGPDRWYNSGDVGVQIGPHEFAYVGRADQQVKVRGYRIEPGEIETCIKRVSGIDDCVVRAASLDAGETRLVAYLVSHSAASVAARQGLANTVQARVANTLPAFMVPSTYLVLDEVPTTSHGKCNEQALVDIMRDHLAAVAQKIMMQPQTTVEERLRAVWLRVLGIEGLADDAEFFDLGGTSLSLIRMLQLVNAELGTTMELDVFLNGASIATLAAAIRTANATSNVAEVN